MLTSLAKKSKIKNAEARSDDRAKERARKRTLGKALDTIPLDSSKSRTLCRKASWCRVARRGEKEDWLATEPAFHRPDLMRPS